MERTTNDVPKTLFFIKIHPRRPEKSLIEWILMEDSVLETLLVTLSMIKILTQNFWNFIAKFGSKAGIS